MTHLATETSQPETPISAIPDRDIRQRDIASPAKLAATTAFVVGVGAIGRQVAMQLAAIGVSQLVLIDPDTVGPENLAAQGFFETDLNRLKTDAVRDTCLQLNRAVTVQTDPQKFTRSYFSARPQGVVFCCVDTMEARKFIWKTCKGRCDMFVDGRMAAEVCRVLTIRQASDAEYYESTFFSDGEAFQGTCTAKTTLYCANVAAGLMVAQLTKMYRNIPYDRDMQLNILAGELHFERTQHQAAADDHTSAA